MHRNYRKGSVYSENVISKRSEFATESKRCRFDLKEEVGTLSPNSIDLIAAFYLGGSMLDPVFQTTLQTLATEKWPNTIPS